MKVALATVLVAAAVAIATGEPTPGPDTWVLTTIDQVPTKGQLDTVLTVPMHPPPVQQLLDFARDDSEDVGVRLRAIAALSNYCSASPCPDMDPVHAALTELINGNASAHSGSGLLLLRAAIEADGPLKVSNDLGILGPLLDHPSRDIRAATARALGQLCNSNAITPLRQRYQNESTDQVKLAISATLRMLPCPVN
jgi:HEAT repeat protein